MTFAYPARFNVPFDGVTLKWQLKTYEGNYLKTESVTASSSSVKCAINYAPAARGATDESNYEEQPTTAKTSLYPNPDTSSSKLCSEILLITFTG